MFAKQTNLGMENYLPTGHVLNVEERLILGASLPALQQENQFASVSIQGKILGTTADYYIACGRGKDFIRNKMFFYSLDGEMWRVLFPPAPEVISVFRSMRNRFSGDPTHIHHFYMAEKKVGIYEETRLSATVHLLDWDTDIAPKGALQIDQRTGLVRENDYFEGLEDPTSLSSYVHQRLPVSGQEFSATRRLCPSASGDAAIDFLEPITDGSSPDSEWLLHSDPVSRVVTLHSLLWPGHNFCYYSKEGGRFDALYLGLGDRTDGMLSMV